MGGAALLPRLYEGGSLCLLVPGVAGAPWLVDTSVSAFIFMQPSPCVSLFSSHCILNVAFYLCLGGSGGGEFYRKEDMFFSLKSSPNLCLLI